MGAAFLSVLQAMSPFSSNTDCSLLNEAVSVTWCSACRNRCPLGWSQGRPWAFARLLPPLQLPGHVQPTEARQARRARGSQPPFHDAWVPVCPDHHLPALSWLLGALDSLEPGPPHCPAPSVAGGEVSLGAPRGGRGSPALSSPERGWKTSRVCKSLRYPWRASHPEAQAGLSWDSSLSPGIEQMMVWDFPPGQTKQCFL